MLLETMPNNYVSMALLESFTIILSLLYSYTSNFSPRTSYTLIIYIEVPLLYSSPLFPLSGAPPSIYRYIDRLLYVSIVSLRAIARTKRAASIALLISSRLGKRRKAEGEYSSNILTSKELARRINLLSTDPKRATKDNIRRNRNT